MSYALVLNATYEPLAVVPARRAIVLVVRDRAETVHAGEHVWHSERTTLPVPSVIRLRRFVRVPYRRRIALTRRAVFLRDAGECQYCGAAAENLDHVLPRSRGGQHLWENVVAACRSCNARKGDRTPAEAGFSLRTIPGAPRESGWLLVGGAAHPAWRAYLGAAAS